MSPEANALLEEYLLFAVISRNDWNGQDGDQADFMVAHWERKILEIQTALKNG